MLTLFTATEIKKVQDRLAEQDARAGARRAVLGQPQSGTLGANVLIKVGRDLKRRQYVVLFSMLSIHIDIRTGSSLLLGQQSGGT
jgi:hypothetical protein